MKSLVSYPERGIGGSSRYRGNCSPLLIEDLIRQYKPDTITDFMAGSGTTSAAANNMGIESHCYDLHSGYDIMSMDIPCRSPFTFCHVPYWDIIMYSDVMYSAAAVEEKYGYNPCERDLSRIKEWEHFMKAINYSVMKQFSALEKGGRLAILMGDIKKRGKLYSMIREIAAPGTMEQIVIKAQHNCVSDRTSYSGNFVPIVHEYLLIVRKDKPLIFDVKVSHTFSCDARDMLKTTTWRDVVAAVVDELGGKAELSDIYAAMDGHKKTQANPHWKEKIRQTLQQGPFKNEGRGKWALAA